MKIFALPPLLAAGAVACLLSAGPAAAAVSYAAVGSTVTEDFNATIGSPAVTTGWTDDTGLVPDFYAYQLGGGGPDDEPAGTVDQIRTTNGGSTGIVLYRWRRGATATDFAFGTKPLDAFGAVMTGWRITNDTAATLTEFSLGYTGEQWAASGSENNNQLVVSYQVGPIANLADGTWTEISALEFNSPDDVTDDNSLNGNAVANREVFAPETVTGLSWAPGTDLWIRWFDANSAGEDQGLGIDDLSFTAIPEPASLALLTLGGALLLGSRRRR